MSECAYGFLNCTWTGSEKLCSRHCDWMQESFLTEYAALRFDILVK